MTEIETAIRNVAEHKVERVAVPGAWRVYREGDLVMREVYPAEPVVVCTMAVEVEE